MPYAWVVVAVVYTLVMVGGVVTSTDSGLGCGLHWPLCAGQFLPPPTLHGVLEWSHLFVAGVASVLIVVLAALLWGSARHTTRPTVFRRLAAAMVGTLALQVALGGLVVLTGIPAWLIALHEGGALLLLDVAVATALWLTLGSAAGSAASPPRIRVALWALAAWAGLTSMLGSYLAHLGLACAGFASCVATMAHADAPFGAGIWHWLAALVLVAGLIAVLAGLDRSPAPVRRWFGGAVAALACQAVLGVLLVASGAAPVVLALHEAVGMATGALLCGAASAASILGAGADRHSGRRGVSRAGRRPDAAILRR